MASKINLKKRQAGILLPVFSLPGAHGIGDLGDSAYDFIEFVQASGFTIWQVLPLNPSAAGNSPYTPYSSFAGDEIYISLELLVKDHLLDGVVAYDGKSNRVDYDTIRSFKNAYLRLAYANFKMGFEKELCSEFDSFKKDVFWLDGYAAFMAAKLYNRDKSWVKWPKNWQENCAQEFLSDEREYQKFLQFIFYRQFNSLKQWANNHGVMIMGDLPFYVGLDSADVYFNRGTFLLDKNNEPEYVSGAAPDYFSSSGQRWGHPIYDWDYLQATGYKFWQERLAWNTKIYDILRIDHFRAFDTYWKIPARDRDATGGEWVSGPGADFFEKVMRVLPDMNIVVEDLGDLRPEVHQLRDAFDLMGMRIIQYGFGENEAKENYQLPSGVIAYSGTHDNNTLVGWERELPIATKISIAKVLAANNYPGNDFVTQVFNRTLACQAGIAIVQLQDILKLGSDTRINLPGTVGAHNWTWKMTSLESAVARIEEIRTLLEDTDRL